MLRLANFYTNSCTFSFHFLIDLINGKIRVINNKANRDYDEARKKGEKLNYVPTKFINADFEEYVENKTIYNLQFGDKYWVIDDLGAIEQRVVADFTNNFYKARLAIGTVFLTKEDAEFELEYRKIRAEMMKYSDDKEWNGTDKHWCIYYSTNNCSATPIRYVEDNLWKCGSCIYFSSQEQAELCVREVGEDRIIKYYFKVK